jgi:hypothetical protein
MTELDPTATETIDPAADPPADPSTQADIIEAPAAPIAEAAPTGQPQPETEPDA